MASVCSAIFYHHRRTVAIFQETSDRAIDLIVLLRSECTTLVMAHRSAGLR